MHSVPPTLIPNRCALRSPPLRRGRPPRRPHLTRGPPLWAAAAAEHDPAADPLLQSVPAFEFDQRLSW